MSLYPVFLKLDGRTVLVVGGGPVAAQKVQGILDAGARVTLVAPTVVPALRRDGITIHQRPFELADLDGASYVIAAAPPEVNRCVAAEATRRGLFCNAVDDKASATAYHGGIVQRAGVTLAISTDGAAPALAGLLREALEAVIPADLERWIETARDARARWLAAGVPMAERRPLLLEALNRLYTARAAAAEEPS